MSIPFKKVATAGMSGGLMAVLAGSAYVSWIEHDLQRHLRENSVTAQIALNFVSGTVSLTNVDARRGPERLHVNRLDLVRGTSLAALLPTIRLPAFISPALASPKEDALHAVIEGLESEKNTTATKPAQSPAPATAGMAVATDVSFTDGTATYRAARVELAGTTMSNDELLALLDPKSTKSVESRFRQIDARAVTLTDLSFTETASPRPHKATIKQILLADVVKGRAAVGSIGGFADFDAGKTAADLAIGGAQLAGVDLGQLAHVLTATRTDPDEPLKPVADSVSLNDISSSDATTGSAVGTIASIKEHGLRARPLAASKPAAPPEPANTTPGTDSAGIKTDAGAIVRDLASSISVDEFVLEGLVPAPSGKGADKESLLAIGTLTVRDVAQGTIGALDLKGLRFDDPHARFSLDSASLRKLSLATKPAGAGENIVPSLDALDIAGLAMVVDTADKGSPPSLAAFKVSHVTYAATGAAVGALPAHSAIALEHILVDLPADNGNAAPLRSLGYKQLDITATMNTSYDSASQRFKLDKLTASEPDMGSFDLSLDLANVSEKVVSPNPAIAKASALAVLVQGLSLKFRNTSLVDRVIAQRAEHDGKTSQQERDLYANFVTEQAPSLIGNFPQLRPLEEAVATFVREPRTLDLSVTSTDGLGLADSALLNDPNALINKLTISAKANQ